MTSLFGKGIQDLPYFGFAMFDLLGTRQLIARSGYSKQGGFEIYLEGGHLGADLWDLIWTAGQAHNITPGCPNLIERIEAGLMSYGNEFTRANNPLECGFGPLCHLGDEIDYIGKAALLQIAAKGPTQRLCGVRFGDHKAPPCGKPFPVTTQDYTQDGTQDGTQVGQITSGIYSPRLKTNVGLSLIAKGHWDIGTQLVVHTPDGIAHKGVISKLPF
jgi:dimethylsulfoniopropionate demethylase